MLLHRQQEIKATNIEVYMAAVLQVALLMFMEIILLLNASSGMRFMLGLGAAGILITLTVRA